MTPAARPEAVAGRRPKTAPAGEVARLYRAGLSMGNGDPAARARRVLAARRRSRQQPPGPGPVPAQATG